MVMDCGDGIRNSSRAGNFYQSRLCNLCLKYLNLNTIGIIRGTLRCQSCVQALFVKYMYVYVEVIMVLSFSSYFCYCLTGDVELSNMQLKPEALNALKLPVKVKAGFLGSVKIKVCKISICSIYNHVSQ